MYNEEIGIIEEGLEVRSNMSGFGKLKGNYSGRHHLDATNKMILYPLPHKSIEKKFFLLDSD